MRYEKVRKASFVKRENRFVAQVLLEGRIERVHVKNTGRLGELLVPGAEAVLCEGMSPGRKTAYDLIGVWHGGKLFNIDSQACNKVVQEWLGERLSGRLYPEKTYRDARLDFYWEEDLPEGLPKGVFLEVKGCTLEREGKGFFPDAPTSRGTKHLEDLILAVQEGYKAHVGFVIQMEGVSEVLPNARTDPAFAEALLRAQAAGVGISCFLTRPEPDGLWVSECRGSLAYLDRKE